MLPAFHPWGRLKLPKPRLRAFPAWWRLALSKPLLRAFHPLVRLALPKLRLPAFHPWGRLALPEPRLPSLPPLREVGSCSLLLKYIANTLKPISCSGNKTKHSGKQKQLLHALISSLPRIEFTFLYLFGSLTGKETLFKCWGMEIFCIAYYFNTHNLLYKKKHSLFVFAFWPRISIRLPVSRSLPKVLMQCNNTAHTRTVATVLPPNRIENLFEDIHIGTWPLCLF